LGRDIEGEAERREAIREETTIAAEEDRPEPVGTVPSMRTCIEGIGGLSMYVVWPKYPALK